MMRLQGGNRGLCWSETAQEGGMFGMCGADLALCLASCALQLRLVPSKAPSSWQRPQRWQKRCRRPARVKDGALMCTSQMRHFWW